jgi:hypothetical protein
MAGVAGADGASVAGVADPPLGTACIVVPARAKKAAANSALLLPDLCPCPHVAVLGSQLGAPGRVRLFCIAASQWLLGERKKKRARSTRSTAAIVCPS